MTFRARGSCVDGAIVCLDAIVAVITRLFVQTEGLLVQRALLSVERGQERREIGEYGTVVAGWMIELDNIIEELNVGPFGARE
jgi:hypothetical protein